MTQDPSGSPGGSFDEPDDNGDDPANYRGDEGFEGRLGPLPPGAIVGSLCVGLVGGWLIRRIASYAGQSAPLVSWSQPLALFFSAAILGLLAWNTRRALDGLQTRPEAHRLVNRLVLARACALAGALVAGGYLGYALSWLGDPGQLAGQRVLRSGLAGLGGLLVLAIALVLERACRVRGGGEKS